MKLIGLTGKAGSGKDHVCRILQTLFPGTVRVAFADGIKTDIEQALGAHTIPALHNKPYTHETRSLLQWWGTELRRSRDPEYWVSIALPKIELARVQGAPLVVVTDVRYENEAETIDALWGLVVKVEAADLIRKERLGGTLPPDHLSERLGFPVQASIVNNSEPIADDETVKWLGLDPLCLHCHRLVLHNHHDSGETTGWTQPPEPYLVQL